MQIIHLSDLHLGEPISDGRFAVLRDELLARIDAEGGEQLLIITGDLVNQGTLQNLQHARNLLNPLLNCLPTRICPGNHDYGNFWATMRNYARNFHVVFGDLLEQSGNLPSRHPTGTPTHSRYPLVDLFEDLVLIGLDSVGEELHWYDMVGADGQLGAHQLHTLNRILDQPEVTSRRRLLYLHHHPFHALHALHRLKDADAFTHIIQDRVDILLFGHNHHGTDYSAISSQYGIPLALDASSSTAKGLTTDRLRYRSLDPHTLTYQNHQVLLPEGVR